MNFKIFCQVLRFFYRTLMRFTELNQVFCIYLVAAGQWPTHLHTLSDGRLALHSSARHATNCFLSSFRFLFRSIFSLLYQPCWSLNRHYLAGSRTKSFHSSCSQFLPALTRFSLSHSSFNFLMLKWKTIDSLSSSVTSFWMRTKSD